MGLFILAIQKCNQMVIIERRKGGGGGTNVFKGGPFISAAKRTKHFKGDLFYQII